MTWLLMLLLLTSLFTLALTTKYRDIAYNAKESLTLEKQKHVEEIAAIQNKFFQMALDSNERIAALEDIVKLHRGS